MSVTQQRYKPAVLKHDLVKLTCSVGT